MVSFSFPSLLPLGSSSAERGTAKTGAVRPVLPGGALSLLPGRPLSVLRFQQGNQSRGPEMWESKKGGTDFLRQCKDHLRERGGRTKYLL